MSFLGHFYWKEKVFSLFSKLLKVFSKQNWVLNNVGSLILFETNDRKNLHVEDHLKVFQPLKKC